MAYGPTKGPTPWLLLFLVYFAMEWTWAHEGHDHYVPREDQGADLRDGRFTRDTRHIKEDIEEYFKMNQTAIESLSEKDLEYYYFVLHDFDKNNKLDGLELLKAIQHVVEHSPGGAEKAVKNLDGFAIAIDQVLQSDDLDKDGFMSYAEFMYAQKKYGSPP